MLTIVKARKEEYVKHKAELLAIFFQSMSEDRQKQHVDEKKEEEYITHIFDVGGYGYFALENDILVGFITAYGLSHDSLLPDTIEQKFPVDKCLYLSEMAVRKNLRGKEIGTKLIKAFIESIDKKSWDYLFIRAWKTNERAIHFYKKFGFKEDEIIEQEKRRKYTKEKFIIQKQYFWQKVK